MSAEETITSRARPQRKSSPLVSGDSVTSESSSRIDVHCILELKTSGRLETSGHYIKEE